MCVLTNKTMNAGGWTAGNVVAIVFQHTFSFKLKTLLE